MAKLAQGAWLGAGCRSPSCTQSYFPTKENPWGLGFARWRAPAKQQGPGIQVQPSTALRYAERRAGGENGLRCFPELRRLGVVVCCQGEFPFAGCSSQKLVLGRRCEGASALSGRAGSGGMAGDWAQKAVERPILLPHEGEPDGSGFWAPETPSKAAGPREQGAAQPRFALWIAEGRGCKQLVLSFCTEAR